jgi:putative hydrolase of the HAD superfamily
VDEAVVGIQAVIFDAAGTLIRVREPVGETYARFAGQHGVALPPSRIEEAFQRVMTHARPDPERGESLAQAALRERDWWRARVRETFRAADGMARFDDFEGFFQALYAHYARAEVWELLPDAREMLEELAASGLRLAVVSNFDQRLRGILRGLGIHRYFGAVTLPADAGAAKPDRAIFEVCLKRLGIAPHRAVYVGDRAEEDVRAATGVGLHAVDVSGLATLAEIPARVRALPRAAAAPTQPARRLRPARAPQKLS